MTDIYRDLNQRDPFVKDNEFLRNIETIHQSIQNILSTRKGERLFNPDFGIDLEDSLFDLLDDVSSLEVLREVTEAVNLWEPRVEIIHNLTEIVPNVDNHSFDVKLVVKVIGFEEQIVEVVGELSPT